MSVAIELISAYVPLMVRDRLTRSSSGFQAEPIAKNHGAVLFADISGFTSLTERLATKGAIGSEELTSALNAYFDRLIERIAENGGDVVKMAGDALIAVWPVIGGESLAEVTLRAASCGLAVGATLQNYEVAEGIRLTCKVGIGAGEVVSMFVGGLFDRWEWLLAGSPLVQMGQAEHEARPGDVVLSAEAWALVGHRCVGDPVGEGLRRLKRAEPIKPRALEGSRVDDLEERLLRSLIPAAIRTRLDAGQTEWLGELRRLSVLFINLPPTESDRPDALELARNIIHEVQAALYSQEGSLNKLSVDEKGTTVIAALGLPPLAHRDDARRAVNAALGVFDRLDKIGVRCSIGVATGRVYCGEIGNARRREYTIIGRVVNLAARLMQAAHMDDHGILCDEETARATRSCHEYQALPPRSLKNIEGPVALFRPTVEIPDCGERRTIIGRTAEQARLSSRLEALWRGEGGVVVIEGEPGIGKSQLLHDLIVRGEARGAVSLVGSADAIQKSSPYHAWRPLFATLAGEVEGENLEVKLARVEQWLGDDAELMPLLNVVLPLDLPDTERTLPMTGLARANSTNDLLAKILGRVSKRGPTIVAIDDAHWMDSASWALTLRVAREPDGALLIVAIRPRSTVLPDQHQFLTQIADELLDLGQLSDEEGVRLARQSLGVDALPGPVEALILRKAQGNPLYCEELARALVDSGLITIEDGHCRIKDGVDFEHVGIPDSVEGIINHRVDRLDPSEQMALKVASVIGRLFRLNLLQDVYPIEPDRPVVPQHLVSLSKTELIQPEQPEPDLSYLFRHVITRDVVYDRLTFAHRRKLHHEVAEWYERSLNAALSSDYPLLAHHWSLAGNDFRAIDALEKAGESALRNGAYQEAVDFLSRAISLQAKQSVDEESAQARQARWEYLLGEAHLSLGHLVQSREHTARALTLLGRPIPTTMVRLVRGYAGQIGSQLAARFGVRTRPANGSSLLRLASSAYGLIGQLAYFDQDRGIGVYAALRSLNLAESSGESVELARALAVMCVASGLAPAHSLAEIYRRRAFEVVSGLDDPPARAWVLQLTGMYDLGIGRWDRAKESLAEAVTINRRLGDWRRWEESSGELGRLWLDIAQYGRAAATFQEFGEEAGRRGHDQAIAWGYHGRSRALIRQGRFDEAATLLELSTALPAEALGIGDSILRGGLLAQLHVGRRDWTAAKEAADYASTLIRSSPPMVSYSLEGYAGVAEAYLSLWEAGVGANPRKSALGAMQRLATIARVYPAGQPRAWLCHARAHRLLGESRRARRAWRKALEGSARLQMPYEQAIALLESSHDLGQSDDERTRRGDQARAILETIGAVSLTL